MPLAFCTFILKPESIIQIGGQSSQVIELEDGLKKPWKTASNPLCAAGTGRFLEQQSYRLGIKIEDFGSMALKFAGSAPRIAARCSVFAKSDLIHLQQKGVSVEAMLYALSESIARMVLALKKGPFAEPVYFGGWRGGQRRYRQDTWRNAGGTCRTSLSRSMSRLIIYILKPSALPCYLATKPPRPGFCLKMKPAKSIMKLPNWKIWFCPAMRLTDGITAAGKGYLGVDVGSTSTKAVILDESGKHILAKNYLMTAGRPVDAVKQVLANLVKDGAEKITIAGVGVTGSGRYLIGSLIGADTIKNEITAQTRAAVDIDPEADIIEIGGQDSKLVIKRNGVVVDYQMNKACAAGTGSFIDEMAEMLGVSVKSGEFAESGFECRTYYRSGHSLCGFYGTGGSFCPA